MSALSMRETAEAVGLSYERFRKVWPALPDFPRPFRARTWAAEAIAAWIYQRSGAEPPEPRALPPPAATRRERAMLEQLRHSDPTAQP